MLKYSIGESAERRAKSQENKLKTFGYREIVILKWMKISYWEHTPSECVRLCVCVWIWCLVRFINRKTFAILLHRCLLCSQQWKSIETFTVAPMKTKIAHIKCKVAKKHGRKFSSNTSERQREWEKCSGLFRIFLLIFVLNENFRVSAIERTAAW